MLEVEGCAAYERGRRTRGDWLRVGFSTDVPQPANPDRSRIGYRTSI